MHPLSDEILREANREAIYNLYLYFSHLTNPEEGDTLKDILEDIRDKKLNLSPDTTQQIRIFQNTLTDNPSLADTTISNLTRSPSGLTACVFTRTNGRISVAFKGTGQGEWIDNGEGLSGIPEENLYFLYQKDGTFRPTVVSDDYATDQQVEALNWFRKIAAREGWEQGANVTISGHSKGGNKAQFVAIHTEWIHNCYSFDGQGFSPEAIAVFQTQYWEDFTSRCSKIMSFSAENDYVNVLGKRLMPAEQVYYFKSRASLHPLEAILDDRGNFYPQCKQGSLSKFVESVSDDLMATAPAIRSYATLGVMNVFQKHFGKGIPVNDDKVSVEKTIAGVALTIRHILRRFY